MKFLRLVIGVAALALTFPAMAKEGGSVRLPEGFVSIAPMVVPILDDYRLPGRLTVSFTVQSEDDEVAHEFALRKPVAVDIYMRHLTEFARVWVDPSRPVDVPRLTTALQAATEQFVPKKGAKVYVLEAVVDRR